MLRDVFGIRKAHQLATAAAVRDVPVGTAAASEGALSVESLDPAAAVAFGVADPCGYVTRKSAMRVPSIRRGRNLICGTTSTLPLVGALVTGEAAAPTSSTARLLRTLDPTTTPAYTIAWTVDDLLFYGVCWWQVVERDATDYPVAIRRIPREYVSVDQVRRKVSFYGVEQSDRDVIRFDGIDEGILTDAAAAMIVACALSLIDGAKRQADDDWSGLILKLAENAPELSTRKGSCGIPGDDRSAVDYLLDTWTAARRMRSTAYLNASINAEKISVGAAERQMAELWGVVSSELARLLNLPASRIGAPQGSGMTYTNVEGDRRDLVDTTLAPFLAVISQRLSMPDVTPSTTVATFDLTAYLRGTTTELVTAGNQAVQGELASRAEVRTRWLGLPPAPAITDRTSTDPQPEGNPEA